MNKRGKAAQRGRRAPRRGAAVAGLLLPLLLAPAGRADDTVTLRGGANAPCAVVFDRAGQGLRVVTHDGRILAETRPPAPPPRQAAGPEQPGRFHDSPHFTFAESGGAATTAVRRQVIAVKEAGILIVLDRAETGLRDQFWQLPAAHFAADEPGQQIATGDGVTLRHFGPHVTYRPDGTTGLLVAVRPRGAGPMITLIAPEDSPAAERIETADSIGFSLTDTNSLRVVCVLASGPTPVSVRQLDVRAGFVLMAGRPNEPLHGLLLGAEIRPPGSGSAPAWSSVWSVQTGAEAGAASLTLPRDCEFCVSEAFEVVAPIRPRATARD